MNDISNSCSSPAYQSERFPWLVFLFLAAVFFLLQHNLQISKNGMEAYNPSEDDLLRGGGAEAIIRRVAFLSLALFAVASLVRHRGPRLRIGGLLGLTMLFLAGWAVLSVTWAEDPAQTLRRLVVLGILCLAAAVIVRRVQLHTLVLGILLITGLYLLIGVSAEIALGTIRPFAPGYRFAGTLHPNGQGINCSLLLLSGIAAADVDKMRQVLFRACALLGLVFLILTASRTAFAAAALAFAVYLATTRSSRSKLTLGLGLGTTFCVCLLLFENGFLPNLKTAVMLGRDGSDVDSFNGRTGVWDAVGPYIQQRQILGYGYGGFWTQGRIAEISEMQQWGVAEVHSAYLECLLDLGLVGLAAYLLALLGGIARAFALHRDSQAPAFAFSGAFLTFCVANSFLESAVVRSPLLVLLTAAVLIELGFQRPEVGFSRYMSYVPSRY